MLAGWIASGRIRKSPAVIHSRSIASRSSCEASTRPGVAVARVAGACAPWSVLRRSSGPMMLHAPAESERRRTIKPHNCGQATWGLDR